MPNVTDWRLPPTAHRLISAAEDRLESFLERSPQHHWHRSIAEAGIEAVDYLDRVVDAVTQWRDDVAADVAAYNERRPNGGSST